MAKRHMGLGKASKTKKQKTEDVQEAAPPSNEITVELNQEADADDEVAQLTALWKTYLDSEKENELVVNGIVHECDRLLRNSKIGGKEDGVDLEASFYAIYSLALAELAKFSAGDHVKVVEFFDAAVERADAGLEQFAESLEVLSAKGKILIDRIPLQYISQLDRETKVSEDSPELSKALDEALEVYALAEKLAESKKEHTHFDNENFKFLEALDDLLDMTDKFGHKDGDEDEDDEDEDEGEEDHVELSEDHPLYAIQSSDSYNQWWRDHVIKFLDNVDAQLSKTKEDSSKELSSLRRQICERIGRSYLQEAEIPTSVFTALAYDDDFKDKKELQGLTQKEAQKISMDLISKALKHLEWAQDEEDPDSWADYAEAMISMGNLYDVDSAEQEELYLKAEKLLNKANNATNGKYEDALENLLQG